MHFFLLAKILLQQSSNKHLLAEILVQPKSNNLLLLWHIRIVQLVTPLLAGILVQLSRNNLLHIFWQRSKSSDMVFFFCTSYPSLAALLSAKPKSLAALVQAQKQSCARGDGFNLLQQICFADKTFPALAGSNASWSFFRSWSHSICC